MQATEAIEFLLKLFEINLNWKILSTNYVNRKIDMSSSAYLLCLDDFTLESVFNEFPKSYLCELANTCTRFRHVCVNILRRLPKSLECINGMEGDFKGDLYYYESYINIMAEHLRSLRLYTSNFASFSKATENCEGLTNLKALRLVDTYGSKEVAPVKFLKHCIALESLELCQGLLEQYHSKILNLPNLKHLEVLRVMRNFDYMMLAIIIPRKGASLRKIQIPIDVFPPIWLCEQLEIYCTHLEEIIFETRISEVGLITLNRRLPKMTSVTTIKVMGTNFSRDQLLLFTLQCPNLKKLIFYFNNINDNEIGFKSNFHKLHKSEKDIIYSINHEDKGKADDDDYEDFSSNLTIKNCAHLYFH